MLLQARPVPNQMPRYFIEVAYKGTNFKGFQTQQNATTIQGEINRALEILCKTTLTTTTSSRTDAGVHAHQNFLHVDTERPIPASFVYNINAILHADIQVKSMNPVQDNAHARFDALGRDYCYQIIFEKNPFKRETAWHMPYRIDIDLMNESAQKLLQYTQFESFSKRNTDVKTFDCRISQSLFQLQQKELVYNVSANRFLRGMVRALVGTLILVGRKKISPAQFEEIIVSRDCTRADFSAPAHGLFLERVHYPATLFHNSAAVHI